MTELTTTTGARPRLTPASEMGEVGSARAIRAWHMTELDACVAQAATQVANLVGIEGPAPTGSRGGSQEAAAVDHTELICVLAESLLVLARQVETLRAEMAMLQNGATR
jgi:hypothetical protein